MGDPDEVCLIHTCDNGNCLYLSSVIVTASLDRVKGYGISHIVSVCDAVPSSDEIVYHCIPIQDEEHEDILIHLDAAFDFIEHGLSLGSVLVHCMVRQSADQSTN